MEIREGQCFRALRDVEVAALTHWDAPFTGGGHGVLPAGSIVRVAYDPPATATAIGCSVEHADRLEARFVAEVDRAHPKYAGYSLSIMRDMLRRDFEPA
jgi:hypothetical protein